MTLQDLMAKLAEQNDVINSLRAVENRSDADDSALDSALDTAEKLTAQIDREQRASAVAAKVTQPQARLTRSGPAAQPVRNAFGTGEFVRAVYNAAMGSVDPRLVTNAAGDLVQENTQADGGYLVITDARQQILSTLLAPENLLPKLDLIYTTSNTVTMPSDEDPVWSASGIVPGNVTEGTSYSDTVPVFGQFTATLAKKGALVYVTEEMIEDVSNIGSYVTKKSADKLNWAVDADIMTAILGSGSKIAVTKANGAAGGSAPTLANLEAMWTALLTNFRKDAIWVCNPNLESVLRGFTVGNLPVYLAGGSYAGAQFNTLLNRPVIYSEQCPAVGTAGDIVLFSPSSIYGVLKTTGVKQEVSAHLKFDQDLVAFKASIRFAAKSKLSAPVTRPDSTTASNVTMTATRA